MVAALMANSAKAASVQFKPAAVTAYAKAVSVKTAPTASLTARHNVPLARSAHRKAHAVRRTVPAKSVDLRVAVVESAAFAQANPPAILQPSSA